MDVKKYIMLQNQQQQNITSEQQEGQKMPSLQRFPTINSQTNLQNVNNGVQLQNRNIQSQKNNGNSQGNSNSQMRIADLKQLEKHLELEKREFLNLTKIKITKARNPHFNASRGKSQESNQRYNNNRSNGTAHFNSNQDESEEVGEQEGIYQQQAMIDDSVMSRENNYFQQKQRSGSTQKIRIGYNTRNNFTTTLKKENQNNGLSRFLNSTAGVGGYNIQNDEVNESDVNLDAYLKQEGFNSNASLGNNYNGPQQLFISKGSSPQLVYEALPLHIREFYQPRKDFMKSFEEYDLTNKCLFEVNERVRCYRYELGCLIDKIQNSFFKIYEKTLDQTIKLYNDNKKKFENQIKENLVNIEKLEREKRDIESTNRDLKNRYVVQESLFKITKINHDSLQSEVILLHDLLKRDVLLKINHIGTLETQQNKIFNSKDGKYSFYTQFINPIISLMLVLYSII